MTGIVTRSEIAEGPLKEGENIQIRHVKIFKSLGYADDLKPAVTSMEEVSLVIEQCRKLEISSGVKLHHDPTSGKCKLLPLGLWRQTLTQESIPCDFIKITGSGLHWGKTVWQLLHDKGEK